MAHYPHNAPSLALPKPSSLAAQAVTVQIYCLSTQWENIDLLSLTHLISCVGDSAFHLSPWQRNWGGGAQQQTLIFFSCPVNEALEHCRLSHLEKLWAGMNVFITRSVSLALVSSANIHKKPNIWQLFSEPSVQLCGSDVLQKSHFDFAAQPKENYLYIRGVGE